MLTNCVVAAVLIGCGAPQPGDVTGLTALSVSPTTLPFYGGAVTLSAQAPSRTSTVTVNITCTSSPGTFVELVNLALASPPSTWSATWTAPANNSTDGGPAVYRLEATAKDTSGQTIDSAVMGDVTVAANQPPPTPPTFPTPSPTPTP